MLHNDLCQLRCIATGNSLQDMGTEEYYELMWQ